MPGSVFPFKMRAMNLSQLWRDWGKGDVLEDWHWFLLVKKCSLPLSYEIQTSNQSNWAENCSTSWLLILKNNLPPVV